MTAVKANRCYTITEAQINAFAKNGYDIYDGDKVVRYADDKTVPYSKYAELLELCEAQEAKIKELEKKAPDKSKKKEV